MTPAPNPLTVGTQDVDRQLKQYPLDVQELILDAIAVGWKLHFSDTGAATLIAPQGQKVHRFGAVSAKRKHSVPEIRRDIVLYGDPVRIAVVQGVAGSNVRVTRTDAAKMIRQALVLPPELLALVEGPKEESEDVETPDKPQSAFAAMQAKHDMGGVKATPQTAVKPLFPAQPQRVPRVPQAPAVAKVTVSSAPARQPVAAKSDRPKPPKDARITSGPIAVNKTAVGTGTVTIPKAAKKAVSKMEAGWQPEVPEGQWWPNEETWKVGTAVPKAGTSSRVTLLSEERFLSHYSQSGSNPGRRYRSRSVVEQHWSDGSVSYRCILGDYGVHGDRASTYSVRSHWQLHVKRGEVPKQNRDNLLDEMTTDPTYTAPAYTRKKNGKDVENVPTPAEEAPQEPQVWEIPESSPEVKPGPLADVLHKVMLSNPRVSLMEICVLMAEAAQKWFEAQRLAEVEANPPVPTPLLPTGKSAEAMLEVIRQFVMTDEQRAATEQIEALNADLETAKAETARLRTERLKEAEDLTAIRDLLDGLGRRA